VLRGQRCALAPLYYPKRRCRRPLTAGRANTAITATHRRLAGVRIPATNSTFAYYNCNKGGKFNMADSETTTMDRQSSNRASVLTSAGIHTFPMNHIINELKIITGKFQTISFNHRLLRAKVELHRETFSFSFFCINLRVKKPQNEARSNVHERIEVTRILLNRQTTQFFGFLQTSDIGLSERSSKFRQGHELPNFLCSQQKYDDTS
jgi:hypothetical protein